MSMFGSFGNIGPLIPGAATLNNPFASTAMWGGNPYSAAFNNAPASISYPNLYFLPFGASPVNIQPPSNLTSIPGIGGLFNQMNLFGGQNLIPPQQNFSGPPPFTLNFQQFQQPFGGFPQQFQQPFGGFQQFGFV